MEDFLVATCNFSAPEERTNRENNLTDDDENLTGFHPSPLYPGKKKKVFHLHTLKTF